MPYSTIDDLPAQVRETLAPDEQQQWLAVFNRVHAQTGDEEKALLAAWGTVRKGRRVAGRAMVLGETADGLVIVKGWGLRFSGADDPDFYGTHWQATSDLLTEYYRDAPLWYEHGFDAAYGYRPIGKRHRTEIYGFGVWAEHVLFTDHPLYARTRREIEAGKLSYSSDSIAHYYEQGLNRANGEVRMWPLAGWSLTKYPAEPGLGPVTLDGVTAVIHEVVNAPARRMATEDARAVVTLTSCNSVYTPQCDPTVPAASTGDPEAREAQRAADGHLSSDTSPSEGPIMTPEALRALADFFGVDATPEAVRAEMDTLIAALRDDDAEIDVAALRAALDLDDDDGEDVVITELAAMRALLDEGEDGEGEGDTPTRSTYNHHALRTARSLMRDGNDDMPHHVPQGARTAGRSRSLGGARFNTGTRAPSVEDAVMAALGIKPPGFRRGTLSDARARLFQMDRAARAADSGTGITGAFVLNTEISDTIMQPLVNKLVLFQAGAYRWPMVGVDSVTIRKQVGLPGAYWAAENSEATQQQDIQWAVATLNLKELRAPTTWPNRWLRNVLPSVEGMIRDSIERSMRLELEYSALYGIGGRPAGAGNTGAQPLGVRNTTGVTVTDMAGAALDVDDLATAIGTLEDNNVEETDTWGWISRPSLFRGFEFMKDANGHPIMRNSWMDGVRSQNLVDYPYFKTNQVPLANQQTDLFFGDWQELVIGIGQDVELVVSEHRYVEQNSTFVMGVAYVDTAVMWSEAFHIHTGCG
ncbi:MAG: hypothetical protein Kow00120_00380 [Anaerolineae bacterium]